MMLITAAGTMWRAGAFVVGSIVAVAGLFGAVHTSAFGSTLELESPIGWWIAVGGLMVAATAVLVARD